MALKLVAGIVHVFNPNRGFGFILYDEGENRVFFHIKAFAFLKGENGQISWAPVPSGNSFRDPQPGEKVVFEVGTDPRGRPCAACWTRLGVLRQAEKHAAAPVEPVPAPAAPKPTVIYRHITETDGKNPKVNWEGKDPNSRALGAYWSPDPKIRMSFSHDDGWSVESYFMSSTDGGKTWTRCEPPVHLVDTSRRR